MTQLILPGGGRKTVDIPFAVRLRRANSARFSRTAGTPTNSKVCTFTFSAKRGLLDSMGWIGSGGAPSMSIQTEGDTLFFRDGATNTIISFAGVFRDTTSWSHFTIRIDTTQATSANRVILEVDGVVRPATITNAYPQNSDVVFNVSGRTIYIGSNYGAWWSDARDYFDGYFAWFIFIDGQALPASSFGKFDPVTGQWVRTRYAGTYGNNGFFLDFANATSTTTIGYDVSGRGNHWSSSGVSVSAGVTFDQVTDTPTNNFATVNPLHRMQAVGPITSWGNIRYQSGNGSYYPRGVSTHPFVDDATGWYCEFTLTTAHLGVEGFGVVALNASINDAQGLGGGPLEWGYQGNGSSGRITNNNVNAFSGLSLWSAGQVGQIAYRNGSLWLGINNTWFNSGNPSAGTGAVYTGLTGPLFPLCLAGSTTPIIDANFGQRSFAYTPPTGFKALCTKNLPTPPIKRPADYVDVLNYEGNGGTQSITGLRFQPDFVRIKNRQKGSTSNVVFDSVRGVRRYLYTESTNAEQEFTAPNFGVNSFDANGFTVIDDTNGTKNVNGTFAGTFGGNYNAWAMKRGATPGFDIVTYTGTGSTRTVSHGLGAVPHFIIVKPRGGTVANGWRVYHRITGPDNYLQLNSTATQAAYSDWSNTAPTSSVFTVNGNPAGTVNENGTNYVAYLWTEVPGFSMFGRYVGNGSADGPFLWCGFKPRFVLIKAVTVATSWIMYDTARNTFNVVNSALYPNTSTAEDTAPGDIDILANGFKLREGGGVSTNNSGEVYVFAAFAEAPFKYATAR